MPERDAESGKSTDRAADAGDEPSPDPVFDVGLGFLGAKALATAVEFGVFDALADDPLPRAELADRTGVHERGAADFFDAFVALDLLEREDGVYRNAPAASRYLDSDGDAYVGDFLGFAGRNIYGSWAALDDALRTGEPQTGRPDPDPDRGAAYGTLYEDDERLAGFLDAMSGFSAVSADAVARRFPWSDYDTVCDLGTSKGKFLVEVAGRHDHLSAVGVDLPPVESHFVEHVAADGLDDRVAFRAADFFADPLPDADVFVLGHVLHNWEPGKKRRLLSRAYDALPEDGALVVYGTIVDDDRRENVLALLMSLNMLVTMDSGGGYTFAECEAWLAEVGFAGTRRVELPGPDSMVVAEK